MTSCYIKDKFLLGATMAIENINFFDLASKRMQWVSDRQRTIGENIANSDVAGYRAQEVETFEDYLNRAEKVEVNPTARVLESKNGWADGISGNNVAVEEQLLGASSANGQYRMATNLYRKAYEMVATVASGR